MAKRPFRLARQAANFLLLAAMLSPALLADPRPATPQLASSAVAQMDAIKSIKRDKTREQQKIDSRLYLGLLHQRNDSRVSSLTSFRFVRPEADSRVRVDVLLDGISGLPAVLNTIQARGGAVLTDGRARSTVSARVHLDDLEALASIPGVRKVRPPFPAMTNATNVSEGDKTHGADEARSFFGVDGTGVKVGVLSNGVDSLAAVQASGDLPAVQVLAGQAGSGDEGTAMLEIVHDLAPGATLAYATATGTEAQFAQNILDLATAGCNVIVDDVIYLDESPFEDSPVAQAVNTVTAGGVLYFSSAGNEGNKDDLTAGTWEGDFLASGAADPAPLAGANLHNFGDGGNSILVEFGGGNPPLLIWAEHYTLTVGKASTDFDLYDMDGGLTTIFDASTDVQDGVGDDDFPIEFIGGGTFGGERLLIDKFAAGTTSSVPMMNLIVFRGELDDARTTGGATRGHSATAAAFSVAATPAAASFDGITPDGPFPGLFTSANASESFTSDGPRRIILNGTDGNEITPGNRTSTGGVVRQKPDITAADGVSCAAPGFNPFYGTSAAAPHAAAIAALIKSTYPALSPSSIRTALVSSAIDIEAAGTDRDTGAGIVMAHAALTAAGPLFPKTLAIDIPLLVARGGLTGALSNFNGVVEPGETVIVDPGWKNSSESLTFGAFGTAFSTNGSFTANDTSADYGSFGTLETRECAQTGDCYSFTLSSPRPTQHWDVSFGETLTPVALAEGVLPGKTWTVHAGASFSDVDINTLTDPFYPFIETIFHHGVTGGCGGGTTFCPLQNTLRQEMAVFLLKASLGAGYVPPACTPPGQFGDTPCPGLYTNFIEDLKTRGITAGCHGGADFCPGENVLRQEMAVFLLKTLEGGGYVPPACTPPGQFADTPCPGLYTDFIEDLKTRGITAGCHGGADFCPGDPVTRQEMAAFVSHTFGLVLYGP